MLTLSENLEFAANHDPLTRLYNRRYLVKQVDGWMRIPGRNFWIILMDVDDFKVVNDTYGHGYGDDVLREAGRLMLEEMLGKGIASRFGGEEFMLVFEEDNREQVLQAFQNIQEGLGNTLRQPNKRYYDHAVEWNVMRQINRWICCLLLQIVSYTPQKIMGKIVL